MLSHPDHEFFSLAQMQRDVSTVVHISARKLSRAHHSGENFFPHRARYCRHRRDETLGGIRHNRRHHTPRYRTTRPLRISTALLSKKCQFSTKLVEYIHKPRTRSLISRIHLTLGTKRLDDQVDRTILQMKPSAIRQQPHLCARRHFRFAPDSKGHGLSFRAATLRLPSFAAEIEFSGRT